MVISKNYFILSVLHIYLCKNSIIIIKKKLFKLYIYFLYIFKSFFFLIKISQLETNFFVLKNLKKKKKI
jgi:hypothetical protein